MGVLMILLNQEKRGQKNKRTKETLFASKGSRKVEKQKKSELEFYFFAFGFALVLVFAFTSLTGFIGTLQQTISHGSQAQASSTTTISPHSSHWYFSPFFFAKSSPSLKR